MKAADLKYRITIEKQLTSTSDFGRTQVEYVYRCSCRARVNYSTGNRTIDNDEIFYSQDRTFYVRSYIPVELTDRILFDGEYWQILSIDKNHEYNNIEIRTTRINI